MRPTPYGPGMTNDRSDQVEQRPRDHRLRLRLAEQLASEGQTAEAIEAAKIAADLNRHHHPWLIEVGALLLKLDAAEAAFGVFRQAVSAAPHNMDALNGCGQALTMAGQQQQAMEFHAQALKQNANDGLTQMFVANIGGNPGAALETPDGEISVTFEG